MPVLVQRRRNVTTVNPYDSKYDQQHEIEDKGLAPLVEALDAIDKAILQARQGTLRAMLLTELYTAQRCMIQAKRFLCKLHNEAR